MCLLETLNAPIGDLAIIASSIEKHGWYDQVTVKNFQELLNLQLKLIKEKMDMWSGRTMME